MSKEELFALIAMIPDGAEVFVCMPIHPDFDWGVRAEVFKDADGTWRLVGREQ